MSENVRGSVVKQNSIRNSNQRCVVIHGSHNVTVSDNVAYETEGHCYMLEDGGELDNAFLRNLGASTRAAKLLVRSFETDGSNPSTFWISNPQNTFSENVAGGSESSGFWFELNREVRPPTLFLKTSVGMVPRLLPLKLFRDNVAHSNVRHGLREFASSRFLFSLYARDIPKWVCATCSGSLPQYTLIQKHASRCFSAQLRKHKD